MRLGWRGSAYGEWARRSTSAGPSSCIASTATPSSPAQRVAVLQSRPFEHPVRGIVDDDVRVDRIVGIHHSDEPFFGTGDRPVAPSPGDQPVLPRIAVRRRAGQVSRRFLIGGDRAIGRAGGVGLESNLPEAGGRAEEGEVDAAVARRLDVLAHLPRPVAVAADREKNPVGQEEMRVFVRVDVGDVGDVVAVPLEKAHARCIPSGGGNRRRRRGARRTGRVAYGRSNDTLRAGPPPLLKP